MSHPKSPRNVDCNLALGIFALGFSGCATGPQLEQPAAPAVVPTLPPGFPPQDIVGRWGLAAYHKEEDRARTEAAARERASSPTSSLLGQVAAS